MLPLHQSAPVFHLSWVIFRWLDWALLLSPERELAKSRISLDLWHFIVFTGSLFFFRKESMCDYSHNTFLSLHTQVISILNLLWKGQAEPFSYFLYLHEVKPDMKPAILLWMTTDITQSSCRRYCGMLLFLHCVTKSMSCPQRSWLHPAPLFPARTESHKHSLFPTNAIFSCKGDSLPCSSLSALVKQYFHPD